MNVVLDARMAFHGGIGRYCRELARTLAARDGLRLTVLARKADGSTLAGANPRAGELHVPGRGAGHRAAHRTRP